MGALDIDMDGSLSLVEFTAVYARLQAAAEQAVLVEDEHDDEHDDHDGHDHRRKRISRIAGLPRVSRRQYCCCVTTTKLDNALSIVQAE
jgi:hypothetical protein